MLIPCYHCGSRDESEFEYGGDAEARSMPSDAEAADAAAWAAKLYMRGNPRGPHAELWFHAYGCRRWLRVVRDTADNRILECTEASE